MPTWHNDQLSVRVSLSTPSLAAVRCQSLSLGLGLSGLIDGQRNISPGVCETTDSVDWERSGTGDFDTVGFLHTPH